MEDGKSQAVNVTGVRGGPLRCETLSLLRQERDEYNSENRTGDQESSSTRTSGRTRGGRGDRGTRGTRGTRGRGRGNRSSGANTSS